MVCVVWPRPPRDRDCVLVYAIRGKLDWQDCTAMLSCTPPYCPAVLNGPLPTPATSTGLIAAEVQASLLQAATRRSLLLSQNAISGKLRPESRIAMRQFLLAPMGRVVGVCALQGFHKLANTVQPRV